MRILATCVMLLMLAPPARAADEKAATVGKQLLAALGGSDGWQRARYLRFDWVYEKAGKPMVTRAHYWDRWSGRYRVDGTDEGHAYRVFFDVNSKKGEVWLDGKRVTDEKLRDKWLSDGYEAFINDTYWLLAPFKIFDPGVNLTVDGEDAGHDILKLSFANVGLTPKDVYWLYVDKKTHLVDQWKYVLDGKKDAPTAWTWSGWQKVGSIELAPMRQKVGAPSVIKFDHLAVSTQPDDAALTPPQ